MYQRKPRLVWLLLLLPYAGLLWVPFYNDRTLFADGLKPLHKLVVGDTQFTLYVGLLALVVNVVVAVVANLAFAHRPTVRPHRT